MSLPGPVEAAIDEPEANWLNDALAGSVSSLGQLLQAYRGYLLLIAVDELGSDLRVKVSPSDLMQDSCLEATRDFSQFQGKTPVEFQAWLRRIALNNIANVRRDFYAREKRDLSKEVVMSQCGTRGSTTQIASADRTASSIVIQNEQRNVVQAAIGKLPKHYQDVIHWRNYERESFEDIGRRLERSADAARKLWVRGLEALQTELEKITDSSGRQR